jgi:hypothetical protein
MPMEITDNKCVVCDSSPLVLDLSPSEPEVYAHCHTCGSFYSKRHNSELLKNWHAPYKSSALLLLREFWHAKHSRIPSLYSTQPQPPRLGKKEQDVWDHFMADRHEELERLANESIEEHRETLRRLA